MYGNGYSEKIIGEVLKIKETKLFCLQKEELYRIKHYLCHKIFLKNLVKSIDLSLKRLKTDYIDLFQLHSPKKDIEEYEVVKTLKKIKKLGKIRFLNICKKSRRLKLLLSLNAFDSIQMNFNLIDQRIYEQNIIKLAQKKCWYYSKDALSFWFFNRKSKL